MFKFLPVIADINQGKFENQQFLPFILTLFDKYKNVLIDDYYPKDSSQLISYLINQINELYPWFLICLIDDKPIGTVWVSHWHGGIVESGKFKYHSCQIHSYIDKKYWGKTTNFITNEFLNILFDSYDIERVQMEIPQYNHKAQAFAKKMGFTQEGIVRCATIKDGKPINHILFSKLKGEHLNGKKQNS